MALEPEFCVVKYEKTSESTKTSIPVISIFIGCVLGLSLYLLAITAYSTSTEYSPETSPVTTCNENIIKYAPLGAYPEGQEQVKAAFAYCDSLSAS